MVIVKNKIFVLVMTFLFIMQNVNANENLGIEKFIISKHLKENIMNSPFKASLRRGDGRKFIAYLYAEDEQNKITKRYSYASRKLKKSISKHGHYYIYLYDVASNLFLAYRTAVFSAFEGIKIKMRMNVKGADFFVLPSSNKNKSDALLISQFGDGEGDFYEAYGFSKNQLFLKKYIFVGKEKNNSFYGRINKLIQNGGGLLGYSIYDHKINQFKLSLSNVPGEIQLISFQAE